MVYRFYDFFGYFLSHHIYCKGYLFSTQECKLKTRRDQKQKLLHLLELSDVQTLLQCFRCCCVTYSIIPFSPLSQSSNIAKIQTFFYFYLFFPSIKFIHFFSLIDALEKLLEPPRGPQIPSEPFRALQSPSETFRDLQNPCWSEMANSKYPHANG